ncbi:MAG: hypothetical protein QW840_00005, partial [Candidatus Bathyarchaeia archaeon]
VSLNAAFFSAILISAFVFQLLYPPPLSPGEGETFPLLKLLPFSGGGLVLFAIIFFSNLVVTAFVMTSLPGFVLFPLSGVLLVYRAVLWGLLFAPLPLGWFLAALPTLVLEGEAYVFAALAGTVVGVSWVRRGEKPRSEAFRAALGEAKALYVFVFGFLLVAAAVEVATLTFFWVS